MNDEKLIADRIISVLDEGLGHLDPEITGALSKPAAMRLPP